MNKCMIISPFSPSGCSSPPKTGEQEAVGEEHQQRRKILDRVSSTTASIRPDRYDFDPHGKHWYSSPVRNPLTAIGKWFAGNGKPFLINFNNLATINSYHWIYEK